MKRLLIMVLVMCGCSISSDGTFGCSVPDGEVVDTKLYGLAITGKGIKAGWPIDGEETEVVQTTLNYFTQIYPSEHDPKHGNIIRIGSETDTIMKLYYQDWNMVLETKDGKGMPTDDAFALLVKEVAQLKERVDEHKGQIELLFDFKEPDWESARQLDDDEEVVLEDGDFIVMQKEQPEEVMHFSGKIDIGVDYSTITVDSDRVKTVCVDDEKHCFDTKELYESMPDLNVNN